MHTPSGAVLTTARYTDCMTNLTWTKSNIEGYAAHRGDVMFWHRSEGLFAEETAAWVSFRAARESGGRGDYAWALRVWTHTGDKPFTAYFRTLAECKTAADLFAQVIANRYDGTTVEHRDHYLVDSLVREAEGPISLWVRWPEQRDEHDIERLARVGVEVSL